jgi:hypothetical protein
MRAGVEEHVALVVLDQISEVWDLDLSSNIRIEGIKDCHVRAFTSAIESV